MGRWERCGSDELKGATITYVEYDGSIQAEKDGIKYHTETEKDWGYCYCFPDSCSCYPTMVVVTEKWVI